MKSSSKEKRVGIIEHFGAEIIGLCIGVLLSGTITFFFFRTYVSRPFSIEEHLQNDEDEFSADVAYPSVGIEANTPTATTPIDQSDDIQEQTITPPLVSETQLKININTATLSELDSLPGIGPVLAQRIIDGRPYSSVSAIQRVSGIGIKTYAKLKDSITTE